MPRRLPITALACVALAGAGVIAGCGSSSKSTNSPPATTPATTTPASTASTAKGGVVNVTMKNIKFVPSAITVKVGQKIVWTNDDSVAHNVTDRGGAFASNNINHGQTFTYTPKKVGTINYECTIHAGQTGTITVTK